MILSFCSSLMCGSSSTISASKHASCICAETVRKQQETRNVRGSVFFGETVKEEVSENGLKSVSRHSGWTRSSRDDDRSGAEGSSGSFHRAHHVAPDPKAHCREVWLPARDCWFDVAGPSKS